MKRERALLWLGAFLSTLLSLPSLAGSSDDEVTITYYGRSCFELGFCGKRILVDPFDPDSFEYASPEEMYRLPTGKIDYAFASHMARDHAYFEGINADRTYLAKGDRSELVLNEKGETTTLTGKTVESIDGKSFSFWTVPSYHDDQKGAVDGANGILCFDFNGLKIVHLGDLGHVLEDHQIDAIGRVDVLMIPVDERYTIDAETAKRIVGQLNPRIAIPMHYKTDNLKKDLPFSDETNFVKKFKNVKVHDGSSFSVAAEPLENNLQLLVLIDGRDELEGSYFGQKPPGNEAELFAPNVISTWHHEHSSPIFTPDGNEVYWSVFFYFWRPQVVLYMKQINGKWTKPEVAPFSGQYSDGISALSPNGRQLFFESSRPVERGGEEKEDLDLWVVERIGSGWGDPRHLGNMVNSDKMDRGAVISQKGTLYFSSYRDGGYGHSDIYSSELIDGIYQEPVNLGLAVNDETHERFPYIAPDESYLLFESIGREDGYGDGDIYISYRKPNGTWGDAVNLGESVNSAGTDRFPWVTFDGKYLFFASSRRIGKRHFEKPLEYNEIIERLHGPGNGFGDVYWVDANIIEKEVLQ